jgi:hypothetical protein
VQSLAIVLMCVLALVGYGVLHDQVTARVCVEYFTVGHPPLFATNDPTLLGLGWGVVATWWAGALLGVALALAARAGKRPRRDARSLVCPLAVLLAVMAAGAVGGALAERGVVFLVGPLAERVPPERHAAFLADLWAHDASYLLGCVGGVVLAVRVWRLRGKAA